MLCYGIHIFGCLLDIRYLQSIIDTSATFFPPLTKFKIVTSPRKIHLLVFSKAKLEDVLWNGAKTIIYLVQNICTLVYILDRKLEFTM